MKFWIVIGFMLVSLGFNAYQFYEGQLDMATEILECKAIRFLNHGEDLNSVQINEIRDK